MAVKFIQASIIKSSCLPIQLQEGCHLTKVKGKYYLVKSNTIEIDFKHKINKHERNHKKRANAARNPTK